MRKLLMVTSRAPLPTNIGGAQRSNLLYRAATSVGHVDLLLVARPEGFSQEVMNQLREEFNLIGCMPQRTAGREGFWQFLRPFAPRGIDRIAHNLGRRAVDYEADDQLSSTALRAIEKTKYDAVIGRFLKPTCQVGLFGKLPVIVDIDDLDTEVYRSRLRTPNLAKWKRLIINMHLSQLEKVVANKLALCRHIWLASQADVSLITHPSVSVLHNIPFTIPDKPLLPSSRRSIVTVGSWNHRPNHEGVDHFLRSCWPAIHRTCPDAIYRIAGSRMSDTDYRSWASIKGVEVIGMIEDVSTAYQDSGFVVAPIYEGGGTKIKVLEALAYGRTAVVTSHSLRGYEHILKDRDSLRVVRNDKEMITACIECLNDTGQREALSEKGRELVTQHFSYKSFADEVRCSIERVLK